MVPGRCGGGAGERTLATVLQALVGQRIAIDLKNDSTVEGRLVAVDQRMNCRLTSARTYKRYHDDSATGEHLSAVFIKGNRIRYVEIPDYVDVAECINEQRRKRNRRNAQQQQQQQQQRAPRSRRRPMQDGGPHPAIVVRLRPDPDIVDERSTC
ncbi:Sm domain-containing protein [Plasmodiophora brassicae]